MPLTFPVGYNLYAMSLTRLRTSNSPIKYYCNLDGPGSLKSFGGQQILIPNLELYNPMMLVIISLLRLLCMPHSPLSSPNQLLHSNHKCCTNLTLNHCTNHNINRVYQLLPKNKLSWREIYARVNLTIYSKLNLW